MNSSDLENVLKIELDDLRVKIPLFDINIKNPFIYRIIDLSTSPPYNIPYKVELTPLIKVEINLLDYEVDKSIYIISPELIQTWTSGFNDILTSVPFIEENILNTSSTSREELEKKIKEFRLRELHIKPLKLDSKLLLTITKNIPENLRARYNIKLRIRKRISPEVRELIENRLTKEYKITRMVKKMEIIRDDIVINELEKKLINFTKKIKRR